MANKKYSEDNPTVKSIRRYEREIEALEEKMEKANEAHDWSMRHFYSAQITAKKVNMRRLINGMQRSGIIFDSACL